MNEENIKEMAEYCLNCKTKPCRSVRENNYEQAYKILSKTTVLESVCGRICPHMSQCMGKCVRGIKSNPVNIGTLEAFVGDMAIEEGFDMDVEIKSENSMLPKKKIAIIGSGPAGLTCAAFLARSGFEVTIFEKRDKLGGLLRYGIPEFRLDRKILDGAINKILDLGINIEIDKELGKDIFLDKLIKDYDAVFIAIGANIPWKMNVEGEDLEGVYGGNSLLEYNKHPNYEGKNVAVVGGGNVAMDCARTINKLGAKQVTVVYRRAEEQMPAERKEIEDAKKEGVDFLFQTNIVKIIGDGIVQKIECVRTELIQKEGESRLSPVNVEGSNFEKNVDYVVMAIGSMPEEKVVNGLGIACDKKGYIIVNDNFETSLENVYAGGDVAGTKATVAWAARTGREVANSIRRKFHGIGVE